MRKLFQSILLSLLPVLFVSSTSADTIAKEKIELATKYIDTLPRDKKILVWPTWGRSFEILGSEIGINESIERYEKLSYRPFYLTNFRGNRPQISIISITSNHIFSEIETIVAR